MDEAPTPDLEQLIADHLHTLTAFVRAKVGPTVRQRESLSDVVQSICVEVLRDAADFDYRGEPAFRAWLFKQALSKIYNKNAFHRRQRRDPAREIRFRVSENEREHELSQVYASVCTPSRIASAKETNERVETALDALPEDYREAIVLHRIAGLSHDEIAELMDRSPGAVRNLVYRGLARLNEVMRKDDEAS